jgi:hypothetical protein
VDKMSFNGGGDEGEGVTTLLAAGFDYGHAYAPRRIGIRLRDRPQICRYVDIRARVPGELIATIVTQLQEAAVQNAIADVKRT